MNFLNIVRQLGLVHSGAQADTYTRAKDWPTDFLLDEVFYGDRDLAIRKYGASAGGTLKPGWGRKVLFWITLALAALAALILAAAGGVTIWLVGGLWLWTGILYLGYRFANDGRFSYGGMLALLLFGLLASFFLLGAAVLV